MKFYRVTIEVMFARLPDQSGLFGFFSTKYVKAANGSQAVDKACRVVSAENVHRRGGQDDIEMVIVVRDIWEIAESAFRPNDDSGATFYPLGSISILIAQVRLAFLQ